MCLVVTLLMDLSENSHVGDKAFLQNQGSTPMK